LPQLGILPVFVLAEMSPKRQFPKYGMTMGMILSAVARVLHGASPNTINVDYIFLYALSSLFIM